MKLQELDGIIPHYHTVVIRELDSQWPDITLMHDALAKYGRRTIVRMYCVKNLTIEIK